MNNHRLDGSGRLNRQQEITFSFDGRDYQGFGGDTLASAMLANGEVLFGRSFKYHRRRGALSCGPEEPNALVTIDKNTAYATPNVRATVQQIYDDMQATSQNHVGGLHRDFATGLDLFHDFFSAGFYYKTFMWPASLWRRLYEPVIRRLAGLGEAPREADPDEYLSRFAFTDVLVIGAGPAGIAAALAAQASGLRVMLLEQDTEIGGKLLSQPNLELDGRPAWNVLDEWREKIRDAENVTCLSRTTAVAYQHENMIIASQRITDHLPQVSRHGIRERIWKIRARQVILATGSFERSLVFDVNDRPGIMLAAAALAYVQRYRVNLGSKIALVTCSDEAWHSAFELTSEGCSVLTIIDQRADVDDNLLRRAAELGIDVAVGHDVVTTKGRSRVKSVVIVDKATRSKRREVACDFLLLSGGWTPAIHLHSQSRAPIVWSSDHDAYVAVGQNEYASSAGSVAGELSTQDCINSGVQVASKLLDRLGKATDFAAPVVTKDPRWEITQASTAARWVVSGEALAPGARAFVDFQNDVGASDLAQALSEGFRSVEHVKRYTTTAMATDQGKTSSFNALAIIAQLSGQKIEELGQTTFRPPFTPVTFGAIAGQRRGSAYENARATPSAGWATENGAVFEPVGQWMRARYYPRLGEDMQGALERESTAVRKSLGIFDASTLGKIEVVGPDATEFLSRIYTNNLAKLGIGRIRYCLMLRDDGYVYDDGLVARLAQDRYHLTTTTGGAAGVLAMMEDYLQTEWPDLKVWLTSVTEQWGVIGINGPNARRFLRDMVSIDLSDEAFPHMSIANVELRLGSHSDIAARLFRASFTGELGYEINVPWHSLADVWREVVVAGKSYDITPYGTEAMHLLRAEKGYIIVGQETDGTVTADDIGYAWAVGMKKPDFIGKRGSQRVDLVAKNRAQLVGLEVVSGAAPLMEGAQIIDAAKSLTSAVGYVSSSYHSATLGKAIALAMVADGRARTGEILRSLSPAGTSEVRLVSPVFYDAQNSRLRGED